MTCSSPIVPPVDDNVAVDEVKENNVNKLSSKNDEQSSTINEGRKNKYRCLKYKIKYRTSHSSKHVASQSKKSDRKNSDVKEAYKYRNVYKSVIRHLYTYTMENRESIFQLLIEKGFNDEEIKATLEVIKKYRPKDMPKEIEKRAKVRIEEMLKEKSISTYILRETLITMIGKWDKEDYGQLYKANSSIYLEACKKFLDDVETLLK